MPGDTILLRAGQTYVGNYTLRAKPGTSTAFITIKSDAPATSLPPAGVRLVPQAKPGANTQRSALARLIGQGGTYKSTPVVRAEPGAHHYRLQFLEIDGTANVGYETLISIGANDSTQTTAARAPHAIVLDRIWAHGHPLKGMKRGIAVNGRSIDILNSYIDDFVLDVGLAGNRRFQRAGTRAGDQQLPRSRGRKHPVWRRRPEDPEPRAE